MKSYRTAGQLFIVVLVLSLFVAVTFRFILPVTMGLLISLVFRPIYNRICVTLGGRRNLGAGISTLIVILCVLLPLILIGVFVARDANTLMKTMTSITDEKGANVFEFPVLNNVYRGLSKIYPMTREEFARRSTGVIGSFSESGTVLLTRIAAGIPRASVALVFFLIAFFFGLVDGPRFVRFLRTNFPFPERDTQELFSTVQKICNAVIVGTLLAGLIQGTIMFLAYWILGIPRPLLFGILTFLFSFVPLVGSAPAGIIGTLYLLANGKIPRAIVMLVLFGIAATSDNIVKPWVLKGRMQIHPLLGLISVLGGLQIFGISGIFLGPIVTASTIVLIQILQHRIKIARESEPLDRKKSSG